MWVYGPTKHVLKMLRSELNDYLDQLVAAASGVREIWLFGSRANGAGRESSDWDLLVIGCSLTLSQLQSATHLHKDDVDCLVVGDDQKFESAWGEKSKSGSLLTWEWKFQSDRKSATYCESKWHETEDDPGVRRRTRSARRLWPNS